MREPIVYKIVRSWRLAACCKGAEFRVPMLLARKLDWKRLCFLCAVGNFACSASGRRSIDFYNPSESAVETGFINLPDSSFGARLEPARCPPGTRVVIFPRPLSPSVIQNYINQTLVDRLKHVRRVRRRLLCGGCFVAATNVHQRPPEQRRSGARLDEKDTYPGGPRMLLRPFGPRLPSTRSRWFPSSSPIGPEVADQIGLRSPSVQASSASFPTQTRPEISRSSPKGNAPTLHAILVRIHIHDVCR